LNQALAALTALGSWADNVRVARVRTCKARRSGGPFFAPSAKSPHSLVLSKLASRFRLGCEAATVSGRLCMIASRASICVLLATSIVGLAGGALAAGKIRLAQTSTVTICMMNCNSAYALCQSNCANPALALRSFSQLDVSPGNIAAAGSCISSCTTLQLTCQTTCARASPSP
jgi:hypothetical protein